MSNNLGSSNLIGRITVLLENARNKVISTINHTMVLTYFEIGRMIVEDDQNGKERADYGKHILTDLSQKLTSDFGKGFSQRNLEQMRQFYLVYSKTQTVSAEFQLSWSLLEINAN